MTPAVPAVLPPAFVPSHITTFGAVHTLISFLPVLIGLYLYLFKGTIDLKAPLGKAYWLTAMVGTITGVFIFHHGGFGPPHIVSLLMALIMLVAVGAVHVFKTRTRTIEIICLSVSYFFLWFFTTTEGLTRFPVAKPFSPSPEATELLPVRGVLFLLLIIGIVLQLRAEGRRRVTA